MKVRYRKRFLKQLARLSVEIRSQIEAFAFEQLPNAQSMAELGSIDEDAGSRVLLQNPLWLFSCGHGHGSRCRRVHPGDGSKRHLQILSLKEW